MMLGGGMFLWLLILIGIIVLVIWWFQQPDRNSPASEPRRGEASAVEILRERYARGEISQEEYEEKRRNLQNGPGGV
jgi:putative membrane protein